MSEPRGTYQVKTEPSPVPEALRPATLADLRNNLRTTGIPKGTGSHGDYERAKRLMDCWRRHLDSVGMEAPGYEECIREISEWVGV